MTKNAGQGILHIGVQGRCLHLVNVLQRYQGTQGLIPQLQLSKQFPQQLQQAANGVVITLGPHRPSAQVSGDLHQQIHIPRQHRVDLHEVFFGNGLAVVAVEL